MKIKEKLAAKNWETIQTEFGERPLVLNIDMQTFFTAEDSPFGSAQMPGYQHVRRAISAQKKLMDAAREKGVPIAHTVIGFREDGKDRGRWKVKKFVELCTVGSTWLDVDPELEVRKEDIFFKRIKPSSFFGTELLELMVANRIDTLIITGSNTSGCVRATTLDSFMYGFHTIIPEDCVGDLTGETQHWANLGDVNARYADVVPLQEILQYFERLPTQPTW